MKKKIIVLMLGLAACLAIESGLRAAEIREPSAKASFHLDANQIDAAKQIAFALLHNNPMEVNKIFNTTFEMEFLKYASRGTDAARMLESNLINVIDNTLRRFRASWDSLNNSAKSLLQKLIRTSTHRIIRPHEAPKKVVQRPAPILEPTKLGEFDPLNAYLIDDIVKDLSDYELTKLAQTSKAFYAIVLPIQKKRAEDLIKYWTMNRITSTPIIGHTNEIEVVKFSPDGSLLASGSDDLTIRLWDVKKGKHIDSFNARGYVSAIAFSPNDTTLAYSDWIFPPRFGFDLSYIKFWNYAETGKKYQELEVHASQVNCLAISPDGKFLASDGKFIASSGSYANIVRVWDLKKQQIILQKEAVNPCVAFSHDGTVLAYSSGCTARLIKIETGDVLKETSIDCAADSEITIVGFSPNLKLVAATDHKKIIKVWNTVKNREVAQFIAPEGSSVYPLEFSPDGNLLVVGYREGEEDGSVRLWNIETGSEIRLLAQDKHVVPTSISFSPVGKTVAVGYDDGTLKLIQADTQSARPTDIVPK